MPSEDRKPFLLRIPSDLRKKLEKWAADELRSINGQIEYLLRPLWQSAAIRYRFRMGIRPKCRASQTGTANKAMAARRSQVHAR